MAQVALSGIKKRGARMNGTIKWSRAEAAQVSTAAADLLAGGWSGHTKDLIREAQKVLPEDRRRVNIWSNTIESIVAGAKDILRDRPAPVAPDPKNFKQQPQEEQVTPPAAEAQATAPSPAAPANPPLTDSSPPVASAPASIAPAGAAAPQAVAADSIPATLIASMLQAAFAPLVAQAANTIAAAIERGISAQGAQIASAVQGAFTQARLPVEAPAVLPAPAPAPILPPAAPAEQSAPRAKHDPTPRPPDHGNLPKNLRHPKLLVVGLLGIQQQEIMRAFPKIEFRFLGADATGSKCDEVASGCNAVFVMTGVTPHSISTALKRHRLFLIPRAGMTSQLKARIAENFPHQLLAD